MADLPEPLPPSWIRLSEVKASVLLVDDHPANLLSLRAILGDLGPEFVEAQSGEEALERVQVQEFAVVLLDLRMPGIDGLETARRIRGLHHSRHTPIILLTASDIDRSQMDEGYVLGAVDFLVKPLHPVALQAKVRGFLDLYQDKQQAKREAEQLRILVEGTTEYAIFMLDPQGLVITWNSGAQRLKGYTADEIIGQPCSRFYPPEALERGKPEHALEVARLEGRLEDEGWRVRKDGSRFWANVITTALRDEAGNLRGFSKITRDITERKKADENARRLAEEEVARRMAEQSARAIREQREQLRVTLDSIADGVISIDAEGRVKLLNPVAQSLTGWSPEEGAGMPVAEIFKSLDEQTRQPLENPALRALKEGVPVGRANDTVLIARDGKERPIDDSAAPIRNESGAIVGAVLVFRDVTERREAEDQLRRSEQRFVRFMQHLPGLAWIKDVQGRYVYANDAAERAFRVARVKLYGKTDDEVFAPETAAQFRKNDQQAISSGRKGVQVVETLEQEDGVRHSLVSKFPILGPDGQVALVGGMAIDVTEQQHVEQALQESEARFRGLMEQAPFSVQVFTPDGRTVGVNRAWEELWGVRLEQIGDYNVLEDAQLEAKGILSYIRRAFAGEAVAVPAIKYDPNETLPGRTRNEDPGRWVSAVAYPLKDDAGKVHEVVIVHDDMTARKRAEEALEATQGLYRAIGESIDYGVWVCDPQGRNIYTSDSFLRLVGRTQHECSEFGWGSVLHPDDAEPTIAAWKECVRAGGSWDIEHRVLGVDGAWHYVLARGVPVRSERGEITAWAGINLDIRRLKQVEEELRAADRRKDEFLATLAHELRNPLAPIYNSLQILKMPRVDAETVQQIRDVMERQVQHLIRLVDDLLDVSRVMRGKIELRREPVELATIIARAVETAKPLIEFQEHQLEISMVPESLLLDADSVRLVQVVGNLLTNSAKYTEAKGHISMSAEREGEEAILRVRDTGIGIAPEMLPHVFELFVQADHSTTKAQGGLGIGLTLVKNLVEMHNGTVEARSEGLGKGCEFVVRLPLIAQQKDAENQKTGERTPPTPHSGHRLLVVDDNQDAAISLSMLLRLQGHDVRVAHDGPTALEIASAFRPDMIFLDIGMPGMDGYEVARRIRSTPGMEKTVLSAVTGWGQQEDRRRTAEAGFHHHLVKPPEPTQLESLLATLPKHG